MSSDDVDLNLLRVFDVLMQERSVTSAADHLGRTQSAVSHSLAKLRIIFKDELFTRDGGLMRPTPRALELIGGISDALGKIRTSIGRYKVFDPATTERKFRVGLTDYHAMIFLPGLIREFSRQAPHATLNVIPANRAEAESADYFRQVDCTLTGASLKDDPNLTKTELGQDRMLCAVWSGSQIAKVPLSLEDYLTASHLQISADGLSEGLADGALKERGLRRKVVATISNYLVMPWVLRGTDLITHCGDGIFQMLDEASEVTLLSPPIPIPSVSTNLVTHRQMSADQGTLWLRRLITELYHAAQIRKNELILANNIVAR
ncbi:MULTISPECIES: LysR family transcriptional regulator [unclassified Rhizobium]|uniref:LysR family transcriptional regulator n=1 Tax=unclassified Rhizobium TaxID=2613769 RepID=UPI001A98E28E|nr:MULTISPECIES: LysR family transcriptional regulator [unclassified Rhizobium]MBX5182557.1 LysR family transcriptional regulator [Rhizobium sp. NZLR5]MBX5194671.1 LysR family transcriptional regulator [Rhizobium sp. NZLR10]MBX5201189.1 LysR family transcriptional regulator [Rhizobium sp. NZLR1]QSZ23074.1 LysR family transcriptional regulator [Rhizobium sp. NZLR1]